MCLARIDDAKSDCRRPPHDSTVAAGGLKRERGFGGRQCRVGRHQSSSVDALPSRLANPGGRAGTRPVVVPAAECGHCFRSCARIRQHPVGRRYQQRVAPTSYDEMAPLVHRVASGEPSVLTRTAVERLVPVVWFHRRGEAIPFTADLRAGFTTAIDAWLVDLFRRQPSLVGGPSYWSISPSAAVQPAPRGTAIPIGFDNDSRYLGGTRQALACCVILAVPDVVARVVDVDAFRYVTALFLMRTRNLRLMSVWHPSFLDGILDCMAAHRDRLIHHIHHGTLSILVRTGAREYSIGSGFDAAAGSAARSRAAKSHDASARDRPHLSLISCRSRWPGTRRGGEADRAMPWSRAAAQRASGDRRGRDHPIRRRSSPRGAVALPGVHRGRRERAAGPRTPARTGRTHRF